MSDSHRRPGSPSDPEPIPAGTRPDLQGVNDQLRQLISSLRVEQSRLSGWRGGASAATPPPQAPPAPPAAPSSEVRVERLEAELARAREAAAAADAERDRLQAALAEAEAEARGLADDVVAAQAQVVELAQRFVALSRLVGAADQAQGLVAIQEIVINLVGSEELAVLRAGERGLEVLHAFGLGRERLERLLASPGAAGRAAETGVAYVAGAGPVDPADEALTAAIPFRVDGRPAGAVAVFRLLAHRAGLDAADHAVFDLLAAHAGAALHLGAGGAPAAR